MESWRASMIPTTGDSLEGNGFVAIANSGLSPRTLRSSTIGTIVTAASRVKHLPSLSRSRGILPFCLPQDSHYLKSITSQTELFLLSVSSEAIRFLISLESILKFLKSLFILTFGLKSSPVYTKSRSILGRIWPSRYHTNYRNGLVHILNKSKRCIDTL